MRAKWRVTTGSRRFGQNVTGGRFGSAPETGRDSFLKPYGSVLIILLIYRLDVCLQLSILLSLACVCLYGAVCVTVERISCIFLAGYYWRGGKLVADKRYVKPDTHRMGADDPMLGLLNMWETEGRRFGNPMGIRNEGRRATDSLPARPKTATNASNRSSAATEMSRECMTCRAKTNNDLMLNAPLRVRPHITQDRTRGLAPPNKLIDSYIGTSCKQQQIYKIQHTRGDADGRMSNTSPYNTLKKLAVPDGPPTMDIIGYVFCQLTTTHR